MAAHPGKGAGAVLGAEPAPCARATSPSARGCLVSQERRTKAGGETKVSTHCQLPNLCNEERSAETSSGRKLTSFCVLAPTGSGAKLRQGKVLLKHNPPPHPREHLCAHQVGSLALTMEGLCTQGTFPSVSTEIMCTYSKQRRYLTDTAFLFCLGFYTF